MVGWLWLQGGIGLLAAALLVALFYQTRKLEQANLAEKQAQIALLQERQTRLDEAKENAREMLEMQERVLLSIEKVTDLSEAIRLVASRELRPTPPHQYRPPQR